MINFLLLKAAALLAFEEFSRENSPCMVKDGWDEYIPAFFGAKAR